MTTMYVETCTGGWATHRQTPTGKTKTGLPLHTLAQAMKMGYTPPVKKPVPKLKTKRSMKLYIEDRPEETDGYVAIGKVTFNDGAVEALGFSKGPSQALNTFRGKGSKKYTAQRISRDSKGKWARLKYVGRIGTYGLPIRRGGRDAPEGLFSPLELADHQKGVRGDVLDKYLGWFQDHLVALSPRSIYIEMYGKERKVRAAPKAAEWLQPFFNRKIECSQKQQDLYRLYQVWKDNRFNGDDEAFNALAEWAVKDSHLAKIESAHRKRWVNRRNDQYKKLAYILVHQAKGGGTIEVCIPPKKVKGVAAGKAALTTEDAASAGRKFALSAAASTFVLFLKNCANREGILYKEIERKKA